MKKFHLRLQAEMSRSFLAKLAAQSLDIDVEKKSIHEFSISADTDTEFNLGLIVGASGSGKTSLAREIFGESCFKTYLDPEKAVIDQFPEKMEYENISAALMGIGLSSVPCWLKPSGVLSNGQRARAEAALTLAHTDHDNVVVLDEFTSVVDRTVAKVMSHCVQKYARRAKARVVLVSCHYDVVEWLDPDWIIDCNAQKFIDRRLLHPDERKRKERLHFELRQVPRSVWKSFSKYHYLSEKMPGGKPPICFGLFHGGNQIGFNAFSNYVPWADKSKPMIVHVHRTVIHPDYAGMGLGIHLDTEASRAVKKEYGYKVMAKFSSIPFYKMMERHPEWRLIEIRRQIGHMATGLAARKQKLAKHRGSGFREDVKTFSFEFVPLNSKPAAPSISKRALPTEAEA